MYIIYTKTGCPSCDRVKFLLSKEPCERIYINCDELLETGKEAFIAEMRKKTGIEEPKLIMFPLIFIDDIFLGDEGDLLNHLVFELKEEF